MGSGASHPKSAAPAGATKQDGAKGGNAGNRDNDGTEGNDHNEQPTRKPRYYRPVDRTLPNNRSNHSTATVHKTVVFVNDKQNTQSKYELARKAAATEQGGLSPASHDINDTPPVFPAWTRKAEIFQLKDYVARDRYACMLPDSVLYKSYAAVATYLTGKARSDIERIRAIFRWIVSLDIPKLQRRTTAQPQPGTPLDYLMKINWRKGGHHATFTSMVARAAGLHCFVVTGINKSAAYQLGKPCDKRAMAARWNAVYVDGQWRLLDVFWASTCLVGKLSADWALVENNDGEIAGPYTTRGLEGDLTMHTVNEFFFLTDADHLIATHFPDDPKWQLLQKPATFDEFESGVYLRDRFFQLGLQITKPYLKRGTLRTIRGRVFITLRMPPDRSSRYDFRYLLFKSTNRLTDTYIPYERYVFYRKKSDSISYLVHFPIAGLFRLDLFGTERGRLEGYDLTCSYLIDCRDPDTAAQPLPDCPDIGWGPGDVARKAGLTAKTHRKAVIETLDGCVDIRFAVDPQVRCALFSLLHNDLDVWLLSRSAVLREENGELVVSLRLAEKGEYALELFADNANVRQFEHELQNVCNYLIRCRQCKNVTVQLFPRLHEGIIGKSAIADELGVTATSHADSLIKTDTGQLCLTFDTKCDATKLVCEVNNNKIAKKKLMQCVSTTCPKKNKTQVDVKLPAPGEYAVNVYAYDENDPASLQHVYSYLCKSTQTSFDGGDGGGAERAKLVNSVNEIIELRTSKDKIDVRIPGQSHVVGELRRKNARPCVRCTSRKLTSSTDGNEQVLAVPLPEYGDYLLDVFELQPSGSLKHVRMYAITRTEQDDDDDEKMHHVTDLDAEEEEEEEEKLLEIASETEEEGDGADEEEEEEDGEDEEEETEAEKEEEPEEQEAEEERELTEEEKAVEAKKQLLRDALLKAMESADEEQLRKAIAAAKGLLSDDEIEDARKMLSVLDLQRRLATAMRNRRVGALKTVITDAERAGFQHRLGFQLVLAKRLLERLRRIERLRNAVLHMDAKSLAELKSYTSPPPAVLHVMTAAFMLLGESPKTLKEWGAVVSLLTRSGKESFKYRVAAFDVRNLTLSVARQSKKMLKNYKKPDIEAASEGAVIFYVWAICMIDEAEYLKNSPHRASTYM